MESWRAPKKRWRGAGVGWRGEEKERAKLGRRRMEGGFRTVGGGPRRNFFLAAVIGCGGVSQWTPAV